MNNLQYNDNHMEINKIIDKYPIYNEQYYQKQRFEDWGNKNSRELYNEEIKEHQVKLMLQKLQQLRMERELVSQEAIRQRQQTINPFLGFPIPSPVTPPVITPVDVPKAIRKDTKEILEKDDRAIEI